eukprot:GFUD01037718.1.p1 GENE.GFUD01037718.1~~GFUD01037718.1.p1  ORF type:complete len:563 (+),score=172.81 GFUD01037718.1:56-1744(+)
MAATINTCIRSLLSSRTFHDLDLVCLDGTLSYPKLLAGLVFPSLATCNILKFPTHHTLLLPDFTVMDVMKVVETVLGFSVDSALPGQDYENNEGSDFEETNDISKYLQVEAFEEIPSPGYESDEEFSPDKPLICKICYATFKTRSGWKNHKVTHQKFRTKEFACYICFRRFYWDKDCRRHIKNIHGEENYDAEESRRAADINYPKSRNDADINYPKSRNETDIKNTKNHPSTNTTKFFHPNNNIFKMKIELLKNQEKKAINENAIKQPNSDDNSSPKNYSPTDTNENTNDCFYKESDIDNDKYGPADFNKESTITMEEIKDHIKQVKDDLGDLLEEGESSDENVGGNDDAFETIDPDLYAEDHISKQIDNFDKRDDLEETDEYFFDKENDLEETGEFVENNNLVENDGSDENNELVKNSELFENDDLVETHTFVANTDFAENNVDGMTGPINSDYSSVSSSSLADDFQVNENLTVDMFDFKVSENILIEPKASRDLFILKKRFKCQECPRRFLNMKYLKVHEKSCSAPADSPYKCTVCDRKFLNFDCLQKHWKINHNRQKMI